MGDRDTRQFAQGAWLLGVLNSLAIVILAVTR
jgi:hypothetical protein